MPLQPNVRVRLKILTERFEGGSDIDYLFKDSFNRVATGYGCDLDKNASGPSPNNDPNAPRDGIPKAQGRAAPWIKWKRRSTGLDVTNPDEIKQAWLTIKSLPEQPLDAAQQWAAPWYKGKVDLMLNKDDLFENLATMNYNTLTAATPYRTYFHDFDSWPADAQVALLSISWSGPGVVLARGDTFLRACAAWNFQLAAEKCDIPWKGPGTVPERNRTNRLLFLNAQAEINEGRRLWAGVQRSLMINLDLSPGPTGRR